MRPAPCRLAIRSTGSHRAEEYIRECEHQDDEGFWLNFDTIEEVHEDFVRYLALERRTYLVTGDVVVTYSVVDVEVHATSEEEARRRGTRALATIGFGDERVDLETITAKVRTLEWEVAP